MSAPFFGRLLTAMVTPFGDDGALDFDVASRLARFLANQGSDGLVVAGSTGEGSSLSDEEKLELVRCVAEAVRIPVIAGATFANTQASISLTRQIRATGAAGVLVTTPAYARPSQAGLAAHLGALADAADLPVMLYDIPSRTGRKIDPDTTIALVRAHSNIRALKDASGDLASAGHVKSILGKSLDLYSGDDALTLPFMAMGAVGLVSVAAHWAGPEFAELVRAGERDKWGKARRLNELLAPSCRFESSERYPNPMPAKAILRAMGYAVGQCRLPHAPSDGDLDAAAADVLVALNTARG